MRVQSSWEIERQAEDKVHKTSAVEMVKVQGVQRRCKCKRAVKKETSVQEPISEVWADDIEGVAAHILTDERRCCT